VRGLSLACLILAALLALKILWPVREQTHVAKISTVPSFEVISPADIPVGPACTVSSSLDESCANELF